MVTEFSHMQTSLKGTDVPYKCNDDIPVSIQQYSTFLTVPKKTLEPHQLL